MPKSHRYFNVQTLLIQNKELFNGGNRFNNFKLICSQMSSVLDVTQIGIWLYSVDNTALIEEITVIGESSTDPSQGKVLYGELLTKYNNVVRGQRIVHFKSRDEINSILGEDYANKSESMMDAPVYSDGEMVGVLCLESSCIKKWDLYDEAFVATCADLVGRILEAEKRQIYSKELNQRIIFLEHNLRKRISELNDTNNDLEFALDSAQAGRWSLDYKTGELSLDKNWFENVGITGADLPKNMDEFVLLVHPDDRERVMREVDFFKDHPGDHYETRYRMQTENGLQWCMERGRVTRDREGNAVKLYGMNFDITALVHWERDLSISESQLKSMIQSIPSPMAMLDRHLKMIAHSNSWVEEWKEFIDAETYEIKKGATIRDWLGLAKRSLDGETLSCEEECIEHPNRTIWIRWLIKPWKDAEGNINGVVMMIENITAKKEAEMHLSQASKLSALGEMAGGIAHEINNPLSIIKGYLDLIRRHHSRGTLDKNIFELYLGKMDVTVGRISRIVNGMKKFSRESSMDQKAYQSVINIIEDTFDICQEKINNSGILLELVDQAEHHEILCHPVEISQVILNLINNSFFAVVDENHPWIRVNVLERDQKIIIEVSDSGSGVDSIIQQKLFQPFFTTKEVGKGTGLGLSISKGIIEEHGGRIYFDNQKPNTTFVIELPLVNMEDIQSQHQSPSH